MSCVFCVHLAISVELGRRMAGLIERRVVVIAGDIRLLVPVRRAGAAHKSKTRVPFEHIKVERSATAEDCVQVGHLGSDGPRLMWLAPQVEPAGPVFSDKQRLTGTPLRHEIECLRGMPHPKTHRSVPPGGNCGTAAGNSDAHSSGRRLCALRVMTMPLSALAGVCARSLSGLS